MAEIKKQKEIKFLNSEIEAVRKLPDVYIGALGNHGFLNMFREILQNSLDEIIKGNTLDKNIIVSYDARNHICIVEDKSSVDTIACSGGYLHIIGKSVHIRDSRIDKDILYKPVI